ncbi:MAG: transcription-repair coupling factor [Desulfobacteraceae bacterium]|nr:MAG: transcription-repair coupling factor [Desulfobacteraceae bacterium]
MTNHKSLATLRKRVEEGIANVSVLGLSGSAQSYYFAQFLENLKKPSLVILPDRKAAEKLYKELQFFMSAPGMEEPAESTRLREFPPYDVMPLTGLSPHREVSTLRLQALYALMSDKDPVILTSLDAICFRILPKDALVRFIEYLEVEEEVERDLLIQRLEVGGYQRTSLVEERGDYSVRGGVIDLFSPLYPLPVRLEFWGDRLESIRRFDPLSQRSQNHLKEMILLPANEIIMAQENIKRARSMGRLPNHLEGGMSFPGQEAWLNHFYPSLDTLFHYLPQDGVIVPFDPHRMKGIWEKIEKRFQGDVERFHKEAAQKGTPFPEIEGIMVPFKEITQQFEYHQRVEFSELDFGENPTQGEKIHIKGQFQLDDDLEVRLETRGRVSLAPLAEKISKWLASRSKVVLVSRTEQQANRLKEILGNYDVPVDHVSQSWAEIPEGAGLNICLGRLSKGFTWPDTGLYVISEDEIFGSKKARSIQKRKAREDALNWSSFSQVQSGDYVVHEDHGIGRYDGLSRMEIQSKVNDYVVIQYAHNDRLYIPADRINILQKYAGADQSNPKLDRLGGRSWSITKQKAKKSVKKIAKQLIDLYALRKYRKGHPFSLPDHHYREFEATFEHEETHDQIKAIEDVLRDMASEQAMDRLICGDVGFGKTEIAIRASFKAVSDAKQVAVLVPTTVLAEQHYETFMKRMHPYSIKVGILSRFKTRAQQSEILKQIGTGEIDVLIGTHRILQRDVKFRTLGLLIIDEEQRFGVKQKEALKRYRATVDVLALTATPIPRTFQMSMMGVRDLSIIETPPEDRLAIQTYLSPYDESLIARAIHSEMERRGQVFFVHNKVQTIDRVAEMLGKLVPQARVAIAHGQMRERELERTMMRFLKKEIDVLVCSTIIESGLDIPSANTIIINEVDRLGLAQIYQLRGRVGRSKEKAYAYLLISRGSVLTRDAEKRLKALMDFSHLGAGIHLAMHDLKIRGGGNILGFAQAGHISAIGYELYLKLIERAVSELKGEEWHEEINPEINVDIPAFLPGDYVMDTDVRLNLYRRLSNLRQKTELDTMSEEIRDRFGSPPQEVRNLLALMSLRLLLKKMGISRLDVGSDWFILNISPDRELDSNRLVEMVNNEPRRFHFMSPSKLKINVGRLFPPEDLSKIEKTIKDLCLS